MQSSDEGFSTQINRGESGLAFPQQMDFEISGNFSQFDEAFDPMIVEDTQEADQQQKQREYYQGFSRPANLGLSLSHNQLSQDTLLKS